MFFFGSTPKKSESIEIRPIYHLVNPDADDVNALKELEVARHKWGSFLSKNPDVWGEEWLWLNHSTVASSCSPGPIRKKFMELFDSKVKLRKKLKSLIRGGVPPEWRGKVWHACSGATVLQKESPRDQQYNCLVERMSELVGTTIEIDISKDLLRTFPEQFDNLDHPFIQSLRRVLSAYALRNGCIGYCQSMNYLAGLMLLHMDEEKAFWTLSALIETILPANYYSPSLVGGRVDQQVFQSCLKWKLPRVHEALRATNTLLEPVTCPWFLCLFVNIIPLYVVCRIWDCLFWEGSTVLFRFGLTMVKSKANAIVAAKDFITIYSILKRSSPLPNITSFELEHAHEVVASSGRSSIHVSGHDESSPVSFGPRSDGEHLIRSAFGYRWLKSVPAEKVNILRAKFLALMMAQEEDRHHHHPLPRSNSNTAHQPPTTSSSPTKPQAADDDKEESRPSSSGGSDKQQQQQREVSFPPDMNESASTHSSLPNQSRSHRSRKSILLFRMMETHDINALLELARECDEGLGGKIDQFADEIDGDMVEDYGEDDNDEDDEEEEDG